MTDRDGRDEGNGGGRPGLTRRGAALALVLALLISAAAVIGVGAATLDPPAASAASPDPIPHDLWDGRPSGVYGSYFYVEGTEGDPITEGEDVLVDGILEPFGVGDLDGTIAGLVKVTDIDWFALGFGGVDDDGLVQVGYYGDLSSTTASEPDTGEIGVLRYVDLQRRCDSVGPEGVEVTGWFAVDAVERRDGEIVYLDLRFGQSCGGAPMAHGRLHLDLRRAFLPIPDDLWDEEPADVNGDYVYIQGADGDPVTDGEDLIRDGTTDPFAVGDHEGSITSLFETESGVWFFEFNGAPVDGLAQPGFYGGLSSVWPTPAGITVERVVGEDWGCRPPTEPHQTRGWFAVDKLVRSQGEIVQLDLRFEQSCDGAPPLHGRIHVDKGELPTTTTSTTSTSTTSTTSTTAPPTTTTTTPPVDPPLGLPPGPPIGTIDVAAGHIGGIDLAGWAIDPDTADPIEVHVYVDGAGTPILANAARPDVGNAFPGYGDHHGFTRTIPAAPGTHQVCAYAVNVAAGGTTPLGCRSIAAS